jgi:GT2 family glycosyltransferase
MISVVIVNWNPGRLPERCVRSPRDNARERRIIAADNASTDDSLPAAAANVNPLVPGLLLRCAASPAHTPAESTPRRKSAGISWGAPENIMKSREAWT